MGTDDDETSSSPVQYVRLPNRISFLAPALTEPARSSKAKIALPGPMDPGTDNGNKGRFARCHPPATDGPNDRSAVVVTWTHM